MPQGGRNSGFALVAITNKGASWGPMRTRPSAARANSPRPARRPLQRFSVSYGLWAGSFTRCETMVCQELSTEMLKDVEQLPGSPESCIAHRLYGATQWVQGNYLGARDHLEQAVALANPERDRELAFRFGVDNGVVARMYLPLVLWPLGEVDQARAAAEDTVALATRTEHARRWPPLTFGWLGSRWCAATRSGRSRTRRRPWRSRANMT